MPNWVTTQMKLSTFNDESAIEKFFTAIGNPSNEDDDQQILDFDKLIPNAEADGPDWYNANLKAWGTKWNACDAKKTSITSRAFTGGSTLYEAELSFDTAWAPASPIIKKIYDLAIELGIEIITTIDEEFGSFKIYLNEEGEGSLYQPQSYSIDSMIEEHEAAIPFY